MDEKLQNLRHSLAHLLAAAVLELYPDAKRAIGPAIDDGFYYDFEFSKAISDSDLPKIEKKMKQLLTSWDKFGRSEKTRSEAEAEFSDNPYKLELIEEFTQDGQKVTFYTSGKYSDLCRGGHVESAREIKPDIFRLSHVAGAYWRGNEKNKMLTRIYGLAFSSKEELEKHIKMLEEAKKRDHKKLGRELDLFVFSDLVGAGLPLWTPKGTLMRTLLDEYVWSLRKERGYDRVEIPHITKKDLYEKSGHWDKFKDDLFKINTREGHLFALKPMNCPHHTQIYARKPWSYRELPQRYANTTMQYRDEQSGELTGLSRVRSISIDDAHVFCRMSQVEDEALKIWEIIQIFYKTFGFNLKPRLSLRDPKTPERYMGGVKKWNDAEAVLRKILTDKNADFIEGKGEAAFYGPKIDFMAADSLGREWQVATIQIDMQQPERFNLTYVNESGEQSQVVMIHAAIMGSLERFLSILIEHLAGNFPVWLSPVQVKVLPISDNQNSYAEKIVAELKEKGLRVELDDRSESIGKKIREAEMQKIPYMLIVGEKEVKARKVAVRGRGEKDEGAVTLKRFAEKVIKEIEEKTL